MNSNSTKIWIDQYDEQVPASLNYPDLSLPELLDRGAALYPDKIALYFQSKQFTYGQIRELAQRAAVDLHEMGFKVGDHLGICLENTPEFVISFFGCLYAGGVVCALNPSFPSIELENQIHLARITYLVASPEKTREIRQVHSLQGKVIHINIDEHGALSSEHRESFNTRKVDHLTQKSVDQLHRIDPDTPAVIQFSGGTTGKPKAAVGSHRNIVSNVYQFRAWLHTLQEGEETFLISIPLYHVYGMVLGLNLGILLGASLVLTRNAREIDCVVDALESYPVSYFPGVPSLFNAINHHSKVASGKIDLNHIKACISGSAPLSKTIKAEFEGKTGGQLIEGYGLSEAPTATHCNPVFGINKTGSIGLPLPDVQCRITDIETGKQDVDQGEVGELWISGPQVMLGYYNDPTETQIVLKNGWLRTGDAAYMDDDGYFFIVGRLKEMIKVNGLQVWPGEVEKVLVKIPGVKDVAVAGVPDDETGERVKAWFVMESKSYPTLEFVRSFCRKFLVAYKIPKEIDFRENLPRSPVGKVLRRVLLEKA